MKTRFYELITHVLVRESFQLWSWLNPKTLYVQDICTKYMRCGDTFLQIQSNFFINGNYPIIFMGNFLMRDNIAMIFPWAPLVRKSYDFLMPLLFRRSDRNIFIFPYILTICNGMDLRCDDILLRYWVILAPQNIGVWLIFENINRPILNAFFFLFLLFLQ